MGREVPVMERVTMRVVEGGNSGGAGESREAGGGVGICGDDGGVSG